MELSETQRKVVDNIRDWFMAKGVKSQFYILGGCAGCVLPDTKIRVRKTDRPGSHNIKVIGIDGTESSYLDLQSAKWSALDVYIPTELTIREFFGIVQRTGGLYEIETPTGFKTIGDLYFKLMKECHRIEFDNGSFLECSKDHLVYTIDGWCLAEDLISDLDVVVNDHGTVGVKSNVTIGTFSTHDIEVLSDEHAYYSNGIVSHNTGKTFIIPEIIKALKCKSPAFATYTAKAALVLKDRGIEKAQTIHSLIYHPVVEIIKGKKHVRFIKKKSIPHDLIVIDEASMVSYEVHNDLASYGRSILYIGDYFQLPPISDKFNLMSEEFMDGKLTEIHRQAESNPIIKMSMDIRNGVKIDYHENEFTSKVHKDKLTDSMLVDTHQIITGKNATRVELNKRIRKILGHNSPFPQKDEKLIFLKNNYGLGVINGQQVVSLDHCRMSKPDILSLYYTDYTYDIFKMLDAKKDEVDVWVGAFNGADYEYDKLPKDCAVADFAYVISCHKSQGSEWRKVIVYDDQFGVWDQDLRARWLYTCITRASDSVLLACD